MRYSFNGNREGVVFAGTSDINASYKDLTIVGDAIRYRRVPESMRILDEIIAGKRAVLYKRHSTGMGSRHELGGRKGRYPMKCAAFVRRVLVNAAANASAKDLDPEGMYVVHFAANKTTIIRRGASKGTSYYGRGMYGRGSYRRSDIELARIEIGISPDIDKVPERARKLAQQKQKKKDASKAKIAAPAKKAEPKPAEQKQQQPAKDARPAEANKAPDKKAEATVTTGTNKV
jgi:ribosomal protein uL22